MENDFFSDAISVNSGTAWFIYSKDDILKFNKEAFSEEFIKSISPIVNNFWLGVNTSDFRKNVSNRIIQMTSKYETENITYLVVCDETINSPEIIDSGKFHIDIYCKNSSKRLFFKLDVQIVGH